MSDTPNHTSIHTTDDLNVVETRRLGEPAHLKRELPVSDASRHTVIDSREAVKRVLSGEDDRLLVVVGPCSIHDEQAAIEYAELLNALRVELQERLVIVMRVYFEKPRTTVGWKGLIYDPHLDGSFDMQTGLRVARRVLLRITSLGLPAGTEKLDPITPQYIADLVTWAAIGARTTESQTHRQMASGLSMPVGFKNSTDGDCQTAIDALAAARHPHCFLGIDQDGRTAIVRTRGNGWGHLILRGGRRGPNYGADSIAEVTTMLRGAQLPQRLMVDCSHANCGKQFRNQAMVWQNALALRSSGQRAVAGLMLESNLFEGKQSLDDAPDRLRYGVSITDACIGWNETRALLEAAVSRDCRTR